MGEIVDKKLDLLCLSLLELVSEINNKKQEQEKHLQNGYLCLAKARYAMGVDRVSKLQYPADMTPVLFVECSKEENDASDTIQRFTCVRSNLYESAAQPKTSATANLVRKRRHVKSGDKLDDEEIDAMIKNLDLNEDAPPQPNPAIDPIKWFGVLVPQSLRQAQECFRKAADISCDICNLRNKFDKDLQLYHEEKRQYKQEESTAKS